MDRFKFRQPVYGKGVFERFHYWGRNTEDGVTFSTPETNNGFKEYKQDEQCTGQKDKSGVLIYISDFIKDVRDGKVYLVEQGKLGTEFRLCSAGDRYTYMIYSSDLKEHFKAIGNIHTNKELLEG